MRVQAGQCETGSNAAVSGGRGGAPNRLCDCLRLGRTFAETLRDDGNPLWSAGQSRGEVALRRRHVDVSVLVENVDGLKDAFSHAVLRRRSVLLVESHLSLLQPRLTELGEAAHEDLVVHDFRVVATRLGVLIH